MNGDNNDYIAAQSVIQTDMSTALHIAEKKVTFANE